MFDRAKIITENFELFLEQKSVLGASPLGLRPNLVEIFESQLTSRLLDIKARKLRAQGKSFYTIGSSGHEGMAVVAEVARLTDLAFLHYRDAAFFIQRSKKLPGQTILWDMLLSFCAGAEDPMSGGRHKVLGSKALFVPPQTSTIASHLPKSVGVALSLQKVKKLGLAGELPEDSVIVCTFGDASLNHASAQTALNCAAWISYQNLPLPIVFVCEDNGIGISVKTPPDWVRSSRQNSFAIKYFECDGLNLLESLEVVREAFAYARQRKKPVFLRFKTVRLLGHAGSDIESVYLSAGEIYANESRDPLLKSASLLMERGVLTGSQVKQMYKEIEERIDRVANEVTKREPLRTANQICHHIVPQQVKRLMPLAPSAELRASYFGAEWKQLSLRQPMAKLINWGLTDLLLQYKEAVVFGEDVAKKGGVYNVTANLEKRFGKNKVFNSLLDETSILGAAIGMAHNGLLPIPEIQFLAYVHNAEDQLRGEAATLSFFSCGQYTNGMVVRIAGLGYQKGFGGHFHNDNSLAIFRDIPGLLLAVPSNGRDAVLMMRSCVREAYEKGKVCVFIEPIALYPLRDLHSSGDNLWCSEYPLDLSESVPPGDFNFIQGKDDLCIISYGNGHYLSMQARKVLQDQYNVDPALIDLRWLAPLDEDRLCALLSRYQHVLIVEECRKTGSMSEGLMAMIMERCTPVPRVKRVCSHDSFIPLADAANLVLVQKEDVVNGALELLGKNP